MNSRVCMPMGWITSIPLFTVTIALVCSTFSVATCEFVTVGERDFGLRRNNWGIRGQTCTFNESNESNVAFDILLETSRICAVVSIINGYISLSFLIWNLCCKKCTSKILRLHGYVFLLGSVFQSLPLLILKSGICNDEEKCTASWGIKSCVMATLGWILSSSSMFVLASSVDKIDRDRNQENEVESLSVDNKPPMDTLASSAITLKVGNERIKISWEFYDDI